MEKKAVSDQMDYVKTVAKMLAVMVLLYGAFLFIGGALIYHGIAAPAYGGVILYVISCAATLGASAAGALISRRRLLLKGVLTAAVFQVTLLVLGMLAAEGMTDWLRFAVSSAAALLGAVAGALLFGGKRKKAIRAKRR